MFSMNGEEECQYLYLYATLQFCAIFEMLYDSVLFIIVQISNLKTSLFLWLNPPPHGDPSST